MPDCNNTDESQDLESARHGIIPILVRLKQEILSSSLM